MSGEETLNDWLVGNTSVKIWEQQAGLEENELEAWVYDDGFLDFALQRTPVELQKHQEYEQLSLF